MYINRKYCQQLLLIVASILLLLSPSLFISVESRITRYQHQYQQQQQQLNQQRKRNDKMLRLCLWTPCKAVKSPLPSSTQSQQSLSSKLASIKSGDINDNSNSNQIKSQCPSYLEQSSVRKCKLSNDEIGYYSKCCLYDDNQSLQIMKKHHHHHSNFDDNRIDNNR